MCLFHCIGDTIFFPLNFPVLDVCASVFVHMKMTFHNIYNIVCPFSMRTTTEECIFARGNRWCEQKKNEAFATNMINVN